MSEYQSKPTCPACNYDLTGLIDQGASATCPECNTNSTYGQATYRKPRTPTIKIALVFLLAIPSIYSLASWAIIRSATSLAGAELAGIMFFFLNAYLPVYTIVLFVVEYNSRQRHKPYNFRLSPLAVVLLILLCTGISELLLWMSFMEWVEAVANV